MCGGILEQRAEMAIEKGRELQVENGPERRDTFGCRSYLVERSIV